MTFNTRNQLEKRLPAVKEFLAARGAEVLAPTNDYEVLRFRAGRRTLVVYAKDTGQLTIPTGAAHALDAFLHPHKSWSAGVSTPRSQRRQQTVLRLLERDGCNCFLCWQPLGEDISEEHLVPVNCGGPNHIANKVLTHKRCNVLLGHKSVMEKVRMREERRPVEERLAA